MRDKIHPKLTNVTVTCSCGHTFETRSTMGKDYHVDVCSACHSFFTGTQRIVDTAGNIEKFNRRYGNQKKK